MKYTVLEMVQNILSSMGSDEVNSIDDTEEATAVARIVKECYNEIVTRGNMPDIYSTFELDATSISTPIIMTIPTDVLTIERLKYNNTLTADTFITYKDVAFLPWPEFLERMYNLDTSQSNVDTLDYSVDSTSFTLFYTNDKMPEYYSTYDDYTLIFDSYDSDEDTFLQKNKTIAFGRKEPTFTLSDAFTPQLNSEQFLILLSEAKSQAFSELKQMVNANAERKARRGWIHSQVNKERTEKFPAINSLPDYSRRGRRVQTTKVKFGKTW